MKEGENYELGLFKRQKTFTLEDVEIDTDIDLNVTFIEKQEDLNEAKHWLEMTSGEVGVDIETRGLDPHQHELIMLQFGDKFRQFVIDTRVVEVKGIIPLLINKQTTLIGQNLKFEYKFFKHNYGLDLEDVRDTLIQEICLHNGYNLKNDLKSLAKRYLNYEADKSIRMRFLKIENKPFSKDEIIYGAYDVILPILIDEMQHKKLKDRDQVKLLKLEHEYLKVLGDMEYKGLFFNKTKWELVYLSNKVKYQAASLVLDKFIEGNSLSKFITTQTSMFDVSRKVTIKWSSSKQVIALLKDLGVCPQAVSKSTKKMAYTVDAKVLKASLNTTNASASDKHKQFIKDYLEMKELEQRVTTFGIQFFKYINPVTKRLHSGFRQIVSTGRSSSSAPNLQNIPADAEFRECFTAPEGHNIVNADFSGQENIVLANKSLDKDLLSFYKQGHSDMHSFIASKIYNKPYEDYIQANKDKDDKTKTLSSDQIILLKERGIAKAAGFAINYGGNGHTISKNLGISSKAGDAVYEAYFKAFSGLRGYFDKVIKNTLKQGYIDVNDVTHRRLNLLNYKQMKGYEKRADKKSEYFKLKNKISRLALNAPIQGTAADITKNAAVRFRKWIVEEELTEEVWITNVIHDEINVESTNTLAELVAINLELCMAKAGEIWCKTVPLKAKAVVGDYWTH